MFLEDGYPNGFPISKSIVAESEFTKCFFEIREAEDELEHATLAMVKKTLALANADLEKSHRIASPVDLWRL